MKLKKTRSTDCISDNTVEYELSRPADWKFLESLKKSGELDCIKGLDRPLYTFTLEGVLTLKGVLSSQRIRVSYARGKKTGEDRLKELIAGY
jgi:hypothetical protein